MKIRCAVVEDEPIARDIITSYAQSAEELELVYEAENALEALKFLQSNKVDLLFLDINMPALSGIDLMKSLPNPPKVIFITAYPEHAVEGFELEAIDYLVKPASFERFKAAVDKYRKRMDGLKSSKHISLKDGKRTYLVDFDDILLIKSMGDYIKVATSGKNLIVSETMKSIEARLPRNFIRTHKSYIANINFLNYAEGNQLKVGEELIPIGATYRDDVQKRLL